MVYTVTFNPALDYVMNVKKLSPDDVSRADSVEIFYGGKGINVSAVLSQLGVPTVALGFAGGFTGEKLRRMMNDDGIENDFVNLDNSDTRINVKIKCGRELDINAAGPEIPKDKINALFKKLDGIKSGDYLVLAGSVPKSLPDDIYGNIMKELDGRGVRFVVDSTGSLLLNVLKYKPFLIKPNHHELGEIFGKRLTSPEEITDCAKELQKAGAANVLVSRGADGAILIDETGMTYNTEAVKGTLINSVGCGDSMVAGSLPE